MPLTFSPALLPRSVCVTRSRFFFPLLLPLLSILGSVGFLQPSQGEDWPWFLGPKHTGESSETNLNLDWSQAPPPVVWKQSIGTGYSAPSVRGEKSVVHHRVGEEEVVSCRSVKDGNELWKYSYASKFEDPYGYNNGPRCSPILTAERCYSLGAEGMLACVSIADGQLIWSKDLRKEFSLPEWFFGVGCSPILDGKKLIVLVGGQPNSGVVAFNADSGDVLWQAVGKETWNGAKTEEGASYKWTGDEMVVSYASPVIESINGKRHLLCLVRQGLVSLDPEDGSLNFSYWFRARVHESVNAACPLVIDDQIFLSAAYQVGSALLKVNPDGKSFTEVWRDKRNLLTHWSTPIHVDGFIYGFSGRHENEGELRCLKVSDGKVAWANTGFDGDLSQLARDRTTGSIVEATTGKVIPYPFFGRGSKILVGKRFIVLGERGTISVVDVNNEKFIEHGRFSLPEIDYPAWAAPVLSNGRLYLRSEKWLVSIDLTAKQ
jgi:outer membrane protein assembly factor BamB